MALPLGTLAALPESQGFILSTHRWLTTVCNSRSMGSDAFFWILQVLHAHTAQTYLHAKHIK